MPKFNFAAALDGSMYTDFVFAETLHQANHYALQKAIRWFDIQLEHPDGTDEVLDESLLDGFQIKEDTPSGFTEANVETAMCLWEAVLDNRNDQAFEEQGTVVIRHQIINLVPAAEELWNWMREHQVEDPYVPYDWEFCPMFIRDCTTWDREGVRVDLEAIASRKKELLP